ncbi:MAG: hypothetical protein MUC96_06905, partial [Myxococcaceae bacterium]|nr:hypothetical protein [Myxococcaceae bacterium]
MRARHLVLVGMALASCSFDRGVPATDGVSSVSCESDRDCPPSADLCASLDPEDRTTRRCVVRATWPSATITGLTVVARDGSPRTRFSRNPGFSEGAILATVDGRPERLVATIDTQVVPCLRDGTSYRCAFTVTADTPEGQNLARVEVTDASGRTFADRVVVDFDFTAPRVVDDSVSTRIAAPADSPLATLGPQWAPEALGRGSVLTVSFSVDEPRVAPPRLALGALEATCARSGAAFVGSLTIDTSVPEGRWPATVRLVDDVGNARDAEVAQLVRDDTPPASSLDGLLVERRPFAAPDAGPGLSLSASFGLEPGSTVLATVRSAAFPIGVLRATPDGGLPRAPLALADAQEVLVTLIDAAGNASLPATVKRYRLHATPGEGLIDNPSDFERRPGWVPQLLVTNDLNGVGTAVRAAFDGRVERFLARPTWRRQVLDAPTFECGAALADTATGSLLIGGAWPGCPSNAPQVVSLRGAGLSGTTEVINGLARLWPTYDSLRGRFVLLSAVSSLPNLTVSQSGLSRFNLPPATTFSGGAYDPRRDQTLAHGQNGELWSLQNGLWTRVGHSGRLDAGLAWVPPLDTIVVFGGLPLDGGALVGDVVRLDGGLLAQLPAGVQRPHVAWDPVEHALRLVDRGRDATWLLRDGGFVAQPPTGAPIEWWAPWPARGDALLNPGSPGAAVWRDGQRLPWALGSLTGGRSRPLVVPRPERGDVLVVGGSSGGFPFDQAVSWRHGLVTAPFPATVAFGGAALVALG